MKPNLLTALVLVLSCSFLEAANCGSGYITPGDSVTFFSNGYSYYYGSNYDCYWTLQTESEYRIVATCNVEIPSADTFIFNRKGLLSGAADIRFVGSGTGIVTSQTNTMTARIYSPNGGGRFHCTLTTKYNYCTECGYFSNSRIVGGTATQISELPHQAYLSEKAGNALICGAAVVHERYALTAAHCLASQTKDKMNLRVGITQLSTAVTSSNTYSLSSIIIHSAYNPSTSMNDIGLVRTASPMTFSSVVSPVCLPYRLRAMGMNFVNEPLVVAGWGSVEFGGPTSNTLLKTQVRGVSSSSCGSAYSNGANANFMCTYAAGNDTCQYDSGTSDIYRYSALNQYNQVYSKLFTVGVTSGGLGCGGSVPSLNVRVTQYIDWIEDMTSDATYCQA